MGRVIDASGAIVPNVSVMATNTATDVTASVLTNAGGEYRITNLLPGNYNVSARAVGFSAFELKGVPVQLNQKATVDITLTVGSVSTTVDVGDAPSVIDTTTAQIQTTQIADLPTNMIGVGVIVKPMASGTSKTTDFESRYYVLSSSGIRGLPPLLA